MKTSGVTNKKQKNNKLKKYSIVALALLLLAGGGLGSYYVLHNQTVETSSVSFDDYEPTDDQTEMANQLGFDSFNDLISVLAEGSSQSTVSAYMSNDSDEYVAKNVDSDEDIKYEYAKAKTENFKSIFGVSIDDEISYYTDNEDKYHIYSNGHLPLLTGKEHNVNNLCVYTFDNKQIYDDVCKELSEAGYAFITDSSVTFSASENTEFNDKALSNLDITAENLDDIYAKGATVEYKNSDDFITVERTDNEGNTYDMEIIVEGFETENTTSDSGSDTKVVDSLFSEDALKAMASGEKVTTESKLITIGDRNPATIVVLDTAVSKSIADKYGIETYSMIDDDPYYSGEGLSHCDSVIESIMHLAQTDTHIVVIETLDENGNGNVYDFIQGVLMSVSLDADVINMSFGMQSDDVAIQNLLGDVISYASVCNIVPVAAAGNNSVSITEKNILPAALSNVISVSALSFDADTNEYSIADYSNYDAITSIYGVSPDGKEGTSFAAGYMSAIVASVTTTSNYASVGDFDTVLYNSSDASTGVDNAFTYEYFNPNYSYDETKQMINDALDVASDKFDIKLEDLESDIDAIKDSLYNTYLSEFRVRHVKGNAGHGTNWINNERIAVTPTSGFSVEHANSVSSGNFSVLYSDTSWRTYATYKFVNFYNAGTATYNRSTNPSISHEFKYVNTASADIPSCAIAMLYYTRGAEQTIYPESVLTVDAFGGAYNGSFYVARNYHALRNGYDWRNDINKATYYDYINGGLNMTISVGVENGCVTYTIGNAAEASAADKSSYSAFNNCITAAGMSYRANYKANGATVVGSGQRRAYLDNKNLSVQAVVSTSTTGTHHACSEHTHPETRTGTNSNGSSYTYTVTVHDGYDASHNSNAQSTLSLKGKLVGGTGVDHIQDGKFWGWVDYNATLNFDFNGTSSYEGGTCWNGGHNDHSQLNSGKITVKSLLRSQTGFQNTEPPSSGTIFGSYTVKNGAHCSLSSTMATACKGMFTTELPVYFDDANVAAISMAATSYDTATITFNWTVDNDITNHVLTCVDGDDHTYGYNSMIDDFKATYRLNLNTGVTDGSVDDCPAYIETKNVSTYALQMDSQPSAGTQPSYVADNGGGVSIEVNNTDLTSNDWYIKSLKSGTWLTRDFVSHTRTRSLGSSHTAGSQTGERYFTVIYDKCVMDLPTPHRDGYMFTGWSLTPGGSTFNTYEWGYQTLTKAENGVRQVTIYANWTPIIYNIVYEANVPDDTTLTATSPKPTEHTTEDGHKYMSAMPVQTVAATTQNVDLSKCEYQVYGYDFAGWQYDRMTYTLYGDSGSKTYSNGTWINASTANSSQKTTGGSILDYTIGEQFGDRYSIYNESISQSTITTSHPLIKNTHAIDAQTRSPIITVYLKAVWGTDAQTMVYYGNGGTVERNDAGDYLNTKGSVGTAGVYVRDEDFDSLNPTATYNLWTNAMTRFGKHVENDTTISSTLDTRDDDSYEYTVTNSTYYLHADDYYINADSHVKTFQGWSTYRNGRWQDMLTHKGGETVSVLGLYEDFAASSFSPHTMWYDAVDISTLNGLKEYAKETVTEIVNTLYAVKYTGELPYGSDNRTVKLYAVWDAFPTIDATNVYVYEKDIQSITPAYLVGLISFEDLEDGAFVGEDFKNQIITQMGDDWKTTPRDYKATYEVDKITTTTTPQTVYHSSGESVEYGGGENVLVAEKGTGSVEIVGYNFETIKEQIENEVTAVSVVYKVTDTAGNETYRTVYLYVLDSSTDSTKYETIRFLTKSIQVGDGDELSWAETLDDNSVWRNDNTYTESLNQAFTKLEQLQGTVHRASSDIENPIEGDLSGVISQMNDDDSPWVYDYDTIMDNTKYFYIITDINALDSIDSSGEGTSGSTDSLNALVDALAEYKQTRDDW